MATHVSIKLNNGVPYQSLPQDSDILASGYDAIWTWQEWLDFLTIQPQPEQKPFKLTGSFKDPTNLDYDIYGLHKKRTLDKGELILIEYFREYDGVTYSDLVVKEERTYIRNEYNLVLYRTQLSTWYLTDDTVGCTKETSKFYSITESVAESETRRSNLIAQAKLYALSQIGIQCSWEVMTALNSEISLYIQGVTDPLKDGIANSNAPYMTQIIKDTIVYILTI